MTLVLLVYIGGGTEHPQSLHPSRHTLRLRARRPTLSFAAACPLLLGLALTFAGVASVAAVAGGWAVDASQYGLYVALAVLALFALTLLSDRLAAFLARPAIAIGERLSGSLGSPMGRSSLATSFVIGVATSASSGRSPARRSDPGPCPRHRGAQGRERRNRAPLLFRVCGWRCDLAGVCAPRWWPFLFRRSSNALATGVLIRRGLGAAGPGRCRGDRDLV